MYGVGSPPVFRKYNARLFSAPLPPPREASAVKQSSPSVRSHRSFSVHAVCGTRPAWHRSKCCSFTVGGWYDRTFFYFGGFAWVLSSTCLVLQTKHVNLNLTLVPSVLPLKTGECSAKAVMKGYNMMCRAKEATGALRGVGRLSFVWVICFTFLPSSTDYLPQPESVLRRCLGG